MKDLKKLREGAGLTQSELAGLLGVSYQQVQKYEKERDRMSLSLRLKMARGLNLGLREILLEEEYDDLKDMIEKEVLVRKEKILDEIRALVMPGAVPKENVALPSDISVLVENLKGLSEDNRKFIISTANSMVSEFKKRK